MSIIAEFTTPLGRFGLSSERWFPKDSYNEYYVVFSLHGTTRTRCTLDCRKCPLENTPYTKPCCTTPEYFLPKFGITLDTHPEYFI